MKRARNVAVAACVGLALGGAAILALELAGGSSTASDIRHAREAAVGSAAAVVPRAPLAPRNEPAATAEAAPAAPASIELATPASAATIAIAQGAGGLELDSAPTSSPSRAQLARAERLERRARRYHRARQLGKAELTYREALEAWPGHALAMAGLARIHLQRKQAQEALRWAERLVALQPDRDINQLLLGDALAMIGNRSEAESAWQRAKELGSRTASSRLRERSSVRR
jgi:tetratricopeptide (TPR) repeat protein